MSNDYNFPSSNDTLAEKVPTYTRVGTDNAGWVDGSTALSAENLNKSDSALFKLLDENSGYVGKLVSKLNNEIQGRYDDVNHLMQQIRNEETTREEDVSSLQETVKTLSANDETLNTSVNNLKTIVSNNQTSIEKDVESAKQELSNSIKSEAERAKNRENTIESAIPTTLSALENDVGYITKADTNITVENVITIEDTVFLNCGNSITLV